MSEHVIPSARPEHTATQPTDVPRGLARTATALAGAVTILFAIRAVLALATGDTSEDVLDNAYFTDAGLLALPFLAGAYVVTCLWLLRARANTESMFGADEHKLGRVWVWHGWWVPVVSLWFPLLVVRDVQRLSVTAAKQKPVGLALWWTCWVALAVVDRVQARLDAVPVWLPVLLALLMGVALWRWALIVRRITDAQTAVADGSAS